MARMDEQRIWNDINNLHINPIIARFNAAPIAGWRGPVPSRQVADTARDIQNFYRQFQNDVAARLDQIDSNDRNYDPAMGIGSIIIANERVRAFRNTLNALPFEVLRDRRIRGLRDELDTLSAGLRAHRRTMARLAITDARDAEVSLLNQARMQIARAVGQPHPANASPDTTAMIDEYKTFLNARDAEIEARLDAINANPGRYNIARGVRFTNDLVQRFQERDREIANTRREANLNELSPNPATAGLGASQKAALNHIQPLHQPIRILAVGVGATLSNIEAARNAARWDRTRRFWNNTRTAGRGIVRLFRDTARATVRNIWANKGKIAFSVGTGLAIKALFACTVASICPPLAVAMIAGAGAGLAGGFYSGKRGWGLVSSAVWGAAGGLGGYEIASALGFGSGACTGSPSGASGGGGWGLPSLFKGWGEHNWLSAGGSSDLTLGGGGAGPAQPLFLAHWYQAQQQLLLHASGGNSFASCQTHIHAAFFQNGHLSNLYMNQNCVAAHWDTSGAHHAAGTAPTPATPAAQPAAANSNIGGAGAYMQPNPNNWWGGYPQVYQAPPAYVNYNLIDPYAGYGYGRPLFAFRPFGGGGGHHDMWAEWRSGAKYSPKT